MWFNTLHWGTCEHLTLENSICWYWSSFFIAKKKLQWKLRHTQNRNFQCLFFRIVPYFSPLARPLFESWDIRTPIRRFPFIWNEESDDVISIVGEKAGQGGKEGRWLWGEPGDSYHVLEERRLSDAGEDETGKTDRLFFSASLLWTPFKRLSL